MTTTIPRSAEAGDEDAAPGGAPRSRRSLAIALAAVVVGVVAVGSGLVGPAAVVLSLPFLYLVVRKPILRRLAVRNASRRPRETMLVILGALLGTAIITSSYVVGDTLRSSIRQTAFTQLGPVDELVVTTNAADGRAAATALSGAHLAGVDGILPIESLQASVSTATGALRAEPRAQLLETDFALAGRFGGSAGATGITGPTPATGEAVLGADLARTLGTPVGGRVTVHAYGSSTTLTVTRILPRRGVAGLLTLDGNTSTSPNIFVAPGTIGSLQRAASTDGQGNAPPTSLVAVSNQGGVLAGATRTASVQPEIAAALGGVHARIVTVKQTLLDNATQAGKQFTSFFQNFGYFSVLAGILLLVNIFVMLAQERKTTLGMLRAVGLRRSSLVGSFSLEGWLYALVASAAGALVGVGIGRLVVVVASGIFKQGRGGGGGGGLDLHFAVSRASIQAGFTVGFVIALVTVVATSLYIARLNVIRAIRDLPEPPGKESGRGRRLMGVAIVVVGAMLTVAGATGAGALLLIGPALAGFGLITAAGSALPRRPLISIVSAAVVVWAVFSTNLLTGSRGLVIFVVQGIVMTAFAIALVTQNQETIGAAIRAVGGGSRNMALRLGLAYPLAKRFRTGLTLGMYSIVVFVLTLLVTISSLFSGQEAQFVTKLGGTAAIEVESNPTNPIPAGGVAGLPGVSQVAATSVTTGEFPKTGSTLADPVKVVGFDQSFIGHGSPQLKTRPAGVSGDDAVYRQVLATPDTVLVSRDFTPGQRRGGPGGQGQVKIGDHVTLRDPLSGATRSLVVAGIVSEARYGGYEHVYISQQTATAAFGNRDSANLLFVSTTPGTDNEAVAATINGRFLDNGADAASFKHLVAQQFTQQQQFFQLIKGYVALGLLVGIAGLGVVMVRAVRERRREIGVLRSLGFPRVAVRRAFVTESSFIALEGILLGAGLALLTTWRLVTSNALGNGISFGIPWLQLAPWLVGAFIASLLATASPAQQAAGIRPAVALRIAD